MYTTYRYTANQVAMSLSSSKSSGRQRKGWWSLIMILLLSIHHYVSGKDQWIFQPESRWDRQWGNGAWNYQDQVPVERSRIAVIGGVFVQLYALAINSTSSYNCTVLEVGCGEGAVSDFLTPAQKLGYVGIDISNEAISIAKSKRKAGGMQFIHAAAHKFEPMGKFDVIIFSEVLYYTDYEKILDQYATYMNPKGIVIISIFQMTGKPKYENIFAYAQKQFNMIDEIEIHGKTLKLGSDLTPVLKTAFRIEVYRNRKKR